jgi:hypothetical protein
MVDVNENELKILNTFSNAVKIKPTTSHLIHLFLFLIGLFDN